MPRAVIIGLGNRLAGDDAFGVLAAEALRECGAPAETVELEVFEAVELLRGAEKAIVVDVVSTEWGNLGEVVALEVLFENIDAEIFRGLWAHRVTPVQLLATAWGVGAFRGKAWVVGVVSDQLEFLSSVSQRTASSFRKVCEVISGLLPELHVDCSCAEKEFSRKLAQPLL
uniref:Hydrogenase maturation protease n=1 Tax=Thermofilum pendens TaxID=2269 RepID=A0A7C1T6L8_THEPE